MIDLENDDAYALLPHHLRLSMRLYILNGIRPGSFLLYALRNDLLGAFGHADEESAAGMKNICTWLYSVCPGNARKDGVDQWIKSGGINEVRREAESAT